TAGATGNIKDSAFLEGGFTGSIGIESAAGIHVAGGPGNPGVGWLLGGFIPFLGSGNAWTGQASLLVFPREICFPSGRALRVGSVFPLPPVLASSAFAPVDEALAAGWVGDARAELASVPAFLRLGAELRAVGAPADLSRDAIAAVEGGERPAAGTGAPPARWAGGWLATGPRGVRPALR